MTVAVVGTHVITIDPPGQRLHRFDVPTRAGPLMLWQVCSEERPCETCRGWARDRGEVVELPETWAME